jgi:hypothetical protein
LPAYYIHITHVIGMMHMPGYNFWMGVSITSPTYLLQLFSQASQSLRPKVHVDVYSSWHR